MNAQLPRYSRSSREHHEHLAGSSSFSSTSRRASSSRQPSEHEYHLTDSKGHQWLTLKVISNAPASTFLPAYFEGDAIRGSVTLRKNKEDSIKAISVQVLGQMTSSVREVVNFVQVSQTLWPGGTLPSSSPGTDIPSKLIGEYSWDYTLNLPSQCQIRRSPNDPLQSYPLPGSFSERMTRVHIQYQVVATVHRGRFRVDSTLGTVIGYCPVIRPDAPSIARQLAYVQNTPLPGPDTDPDGWKSLEPFSIRGSVFSTRTVDARCTLSLAKPLCYTRGSVIPCIMTVGASDPQALDLLSAPRSPVVRLLRHVTTGDPFDGGRNIPTLDFERDVQELTAAVWHPDTEREPHRRVLHGEIHLSTALKPTCRLGKFELTYSVAVYTPKAVAFQPDGEYSGILQEEPVVIGTVHAPGPRPRVHSPPGYDDASSVGRSAEFRLFR